MGTENDVHSNTIGVKGKGRLRMPFTQNNTRVKPKGGMRMVFSQNTIERKSWGELRIGVLSEYRWS